ncbi:MAG: hypothetical protein NC191_01360 [Muribaculaceae bacterium]|nr:hypothetical protein [Muribaculaceae bacterium]
MEQEVKISDIFKHYLSSVVIYGIILAVIINCPVYYETIEHEIFNYIYFFIFYYVCYVIIAPIILFTLKPKSVLESGNIAIFEYIIRQFKKHESTKDFLNNIEPKENEKQAMMGLFVKTFFSVISVNLLCNTLLPSLEYNLEFVGTFWITCIQYIKDGSGFWQSMCQFMVDTGDVWIKLIMTAITLILAFSYLTDLKIFKNKIKSVDTTPLGVLSCLICYYPITILTTKFISLPPETGTPVGNTVTLAILNLLIIIVNLINLIATARLFGKSGNLTNRGIVTGFPYNIVRHPSYTMQVLYIILSAIPICFFPSYSFEEKASLCLCVLIWMYIYYLRAITEERHLMKDEKYQTYLEKVKYRFIPKVF